MPKLNFKILKTRGNARVGEIELNGIKLTTPVFMPVGTKATLKWIPYEWMSKQYLGSKNDINLILNNTFHLHLRPWEDVIQKAWGMHHFENRKKLILTDSWWFQVFSLWLSKSGKPLAKLFPDYVKFQSPYDGSTHIFTPTGTIDIQRKLGSDIMMMLDVCSPVHNITKKKVAQHMETTHKRAKKQYDYHMKNYDDYHGVLFPIIQWGLYPDLRAISAKYLSSFAHDGIAIWGLSVGETKDEMYDILDQLRPYLPKEKPRYLMGVGTPEDIREAIEHGIDMFDCVMPTRLWRHGSAFSTSWIIKLKQMQYKEDFSPLDTQCTCHVCKNFSKAYLHHLVKEHEMLWSSLLSLHNIAFLHKMIENIKQDILHS